MLLVTHCQRLLDYIVPRRPRATRRTHRQVGSRTSPGSWRRGLRVAGGGGRAMTPSPRRPTTKVSSSPAAGRRRASVAGAGRRGGRRRFQSGAFHLRRGLALHGVAPSPGRPSAGPQVRAPHRRGATRRARPSHRLRRRPVLGAVVAPAAGGPSRSEVLSEACAWRNLVARGRADDFADLNRLPRGRRLIMVPAGLAVEEPIRLTTSHGVGVRRGEPPRTLVRRGSQYHRGGYGDRPAARASPTW